MVDKWLGGGCLVAAVFLGSALFSGIRTYIYIYQGLQPHMGPGMFVIASPILAAPIALIAFVAHLTFANFFKFDRYWKWFLSGISYSSILLGLIDPWLLLIPLIFNPIVLTLRAKRVKR